MEVIPGIGESGRGICTADPVRCFEKRAPISRCAITKHIKRLEM